MDLGTEFDAIAAMSATKIDTASNASLLSLGVTGAGLPPNGIYLPSANTLGFSTATTARGTISATGVWDMLAPSANGGTLIAHALTTNQTIELRGATSGTSSIAYQTFADSTGARLGYIGATGVAGGAVVIESDNSDIRFIPLTGHSIVASQDGGATFVDMTPATGSFTCTITGCTTAPTGTATWSRIGKLVVLALPGITATSNATTFTYTGLPAALQPATLTQLVGVARGEDNSAIGTQGFAAQIAPGSGTITFFFNGSSNVFTASGTKGLPNIDTIAYLLN